MIAICEECGQKHRLSPEIIKRSTASFKCKSCSHLITVRKTASGDFQESSLGSGNDQRFQFEGDKISIDAIKSEKLELKGLSIRWKITGVIFLLVLCSLALVGSITSIMSRDSLSKQAEDHLKRISNQKSAEYKMIFDRIQEEVMGSADYLKKLYEKKIVPTDTGIPLLLPWDPEKNQFGNDEIKKRFADEILIQKHFGAFLESLASNAPIIDLAYSGTETNISVFNNKDVLDFIQKNAPGFIPTKRPWYTKAKEAGKLVWTDLYADAASNELCVSCAVPVILSDNKMPAVVAFDLKLSTIRKDILKLDIGYNSTAFLINKEGKVLVKPGMERGGAKWNEVVKTDDYTKTNNPTFNNIVAEMIKGKNGLKSYTEGKEEKYLAYTFLPTIGASLGIVVSKDEVIQPAVNLQKLIILVWIIVLIVAILIGIILGGNITRPINKLSSAADLISQGKVDLEVIEEDRNDEIGVLTKAFNRLVISLKFAMSR